MLSVHTYSRLSHHTIPLVAEQCHVCIGAPHPVFEAPSSACQMPRAGAAVAAMPSSSGLPPGLGYPGTFGGQEFVSPDGQLAGLNSLHPWSTSVNISVGAGAHPGMAHHK